MVGLVGVVSPVVTLFGAVATGTQADRYLQPWVFLPVLAITVLQDLVPAPVWRRRTRLQVLTGVALAALVGLGLPATVHGATGRDADLQCVVNWVNASSKVGAGQFWTVRAAKAYAADPRSLVQVNSQLQPYVWLVNRNDHLGHIGFVIQDAHSPNLDLARQSWPAGQLARIECGRYTILDLSP
ncbi:hypothetical protein GCM10025864_15180 [Luteimicrobium album]|uniref:Peptidase C51 domain-containing protein n=2 Tax=Luteimicrobium album TaxID=1054550 RepID=A0ABQ6I1D7_9MICO|nr:hypothetical protein GCM10025864_15180 [Luteimicrobium album]